MATEQAKPKLKRKKKTKRQAVKELTIEQRRAKVVFLRVRGHSIRDIAAKLGVSVGTIHDDLTEVLVRAREDSTEKMKAERETSVARLELAIEKIMPQVLRGGLDAADRLVRLEQRLAKLKGTDAPTKTELSGPDGAPIPVSVAEGLLGKLNDLGKRLAGGGSEPS